MRWLFPENLITRIWESSDIHEVFPRDSYYQQKTGLHITERSPDVGVMVWCSVFSYPSTFLGQVHISIVKMAVPV